MAPQTLEHTDIPLKTDPTCPHKALRTALGAHTALGQLHTLEKDLVSACDLLGVGAEYARVVGSEYTRALFLLSKGMLLLMERKLQEVHPLLTLCGQIVENWQGNPIQKESLRVFFLVLQVTHYLDAGQVRGASRASCWL
ncbi:mau2 chromatid cohesion factor [Saguinus oedipus]|uniref:Cohesin loading complex subunit SCC4 homolog n=1 Tax=Saguinus oedipus TaxID=9490 RepID=A0ABQ9TTG1_SAGOE|nr:mau2 chromatid cohesion factor [Saguinus oedipus]